MLSVRQYGVRLPFLPGAVSYTQADAVHRNFITVLLFGLPPHFCQRLTVIVGDDRGHRGAADCKDGRAGIIAKLVVGVFRADAPVNHAAGEGARTGLIAVCRIICFCQHQVGRAAVDGVAQLPAALCRAGNVRVRPDKGDTLDGIIQVFTRRADCHRGAACVLCRYGDLGAGRLGSCVGNGHHVPVQRRASGRESVCRHIAVLLCAAHTLLVPAALVVRFEVQDGAALRHRAGSVRTVHTEHPAETVYNRTRCVGIRSRGRSFYGDRNLHVRALHPA